MTYVRMWNGNNARVPSYDVKREQMVDPKIRALFIMFLGYNRFTYEFRYFLIYYSVYYCDLHTYFRDGSTL
jgi:hypothetical protein